MNHEKKVKKLSALFDRHTELSVVSAPSNSRSYWNEVKMLREGRSVEVVGIVGNKFFWRMKRGLMIGCLELTPEERELSWKEALKEKGLDE